MTTTDATSTTDTAVILELEDVRTTFATPYGDVRAVDGVSLRIERGTTLGIVGESGSGKTVLSRSIMRLNLGPTATTTGSIRYEGRQLVGVAPKQMQHVWGSEMSMVFQDPMTSLNPVVRIGRQITEHLRRHRGLSRDEARKVGVELLRSVRIPQPEERFRAYPHQLSGGMRQRVAIAIALACEPNLLLADEPTTALDVTVQNQILNVLGHQQATRNMTMILVTHDLGVVAGRTSHIVVMYAGRIVESAPTSALFAGYQMPYTEALMRAIPRMAQPKHSKLSAIAGRPPNLADPPPGCRFAPRCAYAQDRCHTEEPPLIPAATPGHEFACWYPVGSVENRAAWDRNLAAGLPQTLVAAGDIVSIDAPVEETV